MGISYGLNRTPIETGRYSVEGGKLIDALPWSFIPLLVVAFNFVYPAK
jgi:hypothetical protein